LSLFEYTGNLIGYFWQGEHGKALKWKGISGAALDKDNSFSKLDIAKVVAEGHRGMVTQLEDYRAKIFHYKFHQVGAIHAKLDSGCFPPFKIETDMADQFKKIFKDFDVNRQLNKDELSAYSEHAVLKSFEVIEKILTLLLDWKITPMPFKLSE
jgi:hypothetical protein